MKYVIFGLVVAFLLSVIASQHNARPLTENQVRFPDNVRAEIRTWEDPKRDVVCYLTQRGGISCLPDKMWYEYTKKEL